ncbi:hypothetical protein [Streptomyces flaveolus]|uniref:hypothetical protein n=1 Tax=Streptomyces flaveolus TaxID=67297 RepID=UPI003326F7AD
MSEEPPNLATLRASGKTVLEAADAVTDRDTLLSYVSELSSVVSAIRWGLGNAAWSGELSAADPTAKRPILSEVERRLERGEMDREGATPGSAALAQSLATAIRMAEALHQQLGTTWTVGITEVTRKEVEEAYKKRNAKDAQQYREMMNGVLHAMQETVPEEALERTSRAVQQELERLKRRWAEEGQA